MVGAFSPSYMMELFFCTKGETEMEFAIIPFSFLPEFEGGGPLL